MAEQVNITQLITEGIQERKGRGISIVDLSHIESSAAQRFIICEGTSTMQVSAIADSIREYLRENAGIKPYNYDGYYNPLRILIAVVVIWFYSGIFSDNYQQAKAKNAIPQVSTSCSEET